MEDEKIIDLFFQRSEEALEQLGQKYGGACHRLAYNILGDRRDSEECVNDAYLGVWNTIPPQRPQPLFPYVAKVVRNQSLKRYHHNTAAKRNSHYDVAMEEIEDCLSSAASVEDEITAAELAEAVNSFLASLGEADRVLFLRRYWFSDPYAQIAERLGITEKNVSVRLTRLRSRLRDYLQEREMFA